MSTIPSVLAALGTVAATAQPNLQIGRGTLLETEDDFFIVGFDEGDNGPATVGRFGDDNLDDLAGDSDVESYDVRCLLSVWVGDADDAAHAGVVSKLDDYFESFRAAVNADPTLGLVKVQQARVRGEFTLQQPISAEGSVATLTFLVHVDAWS